MNIYEKKVDKNYDKVTVYKFLREVFCLSNRMIKKLKRLEGSILLNDKPVFVIEIVKENDIVKVVLNDDKLDFVTYDKFVEIAYEDEDCLIYNKPAFLPTHQSLSNYDKTLANVFYKFCKDRNLSLSFRPINRLDKNTSGLVMVAKNAHIANFLSKNIHKVYFFLVEGILEKKKGIINLNISRENDSIITRCVNPSGQTAITHYEVINEYQNISLVKGILETGRTHQIRVHFSYIGHPLIGDDLYYKKSSLINRQALHCGEIIFKSFSKNKDICIKVDLPNDIKTLLIHYK